MVEERKLCRSKRDINTCSSIMFAQINVTDRHLFRTTGEQTIFEAKMLDVSRNMIRHYYRRMDKTTKARAKRTLKDIADKEAVSSNR